MKNKIKIVVKVVVALLIITACSPQELDEYELGVIGHISEDQVSFSYAKSTESNPSNSDNVIQFVNTSNINVPHSYTWDLGNGVITKDEKPIGKYPNAGKYTVVLSVSGYDGHTILKPQEITIQNDDLSLFATETYINLTGGPENEEGKIWVFDQYNNYAAEVRTALNTNIGGHLGLGPQHSYSQEWWAAGPNEKGESKMYDFKFHFKQATGLQLKITNGGEGYGRAASSANPGGYDVTSIEQDDAFFNYNGGDYSFAIIDGEEYEKLILPRDAFMGYYCGTQEYEIVYLTEEVMALRVDNTIEFQDWVFIYIREDLNIGSQLPTITEDQVTFEIVKRSDNEWTFDYSVTVDNPDGAIFSVEIQFGDGATSAELIGNHVYVAPAGTYYPRCVLTVNDKQIVKQQEIVIDNNHPMWDLNGSLTGGKEWKLRSHNQGSGIILTNPEGNEYWWVVDAGAAGSEAAYDDILTFYSTGRAKLENNGDSYMNESTAGLFSDGNPEGSFVTLEYIPSNNATWEFVDVDGVLHLKLSEVFPMYATSPEVMEEGIYQVILLTENLMHITLNLDWGAWHYYLVPVK